MSVSKSSKSITAVTRRIRERHGGSRTCSHVLWEGKHIYSSWPEIGSLLLGNIPYRVDTSGSVPIFFGSLILTPLFVWEVPRVQNKHCMGACSLFINVLDLYISLTFPLVVNVRGVFVFQLVKRAHVWNAFHSSIAPPLKLHDEQRNKQVLKILRNLNFYRRCLTVISILPMKAGISGLYRIAHSEKYYSGGHLRVTYCARMRRRCFRWHGGYSFECKNNINSANLVDGNGGQRFAVESLDDFRRLLFHYIGYQGKGRHRSKHDMPQSPS